MAIYSYDFQNDVRNVEPAMQIIKKNEPTLYAIAGTGEAVANRNAEWIDKVLGFKVDEVKAVNGLTVTVADGTKYAVGMEISPLDGAANYAIASIAGNDLTLTKIDASMANPTVGKYEVSYGGVVEGSTEGAETFFEGEAKLNNTQIFRSEAKLTRTAMGTSTYDNANKMEQQVEAALYDVYHMINRAMWKGYKKLGSSSVAGKLGGIYQFCSDLKVDAAGGSISTDLINEALELIANAGGKADTLICNRSKIAAISKLYEGQITIAADSDVRGVYVNKIVNPYDGSVLQVIVDDMCPTGDVWILDSTKIEVAPFTNGALTDFDSTEPGFDGAKRTVLTELTVKWHNASESFASIRGLK